MFGRRVKNALKRMSTYVGNRSQSRSIFRRESIAHTTEDTSRKKPYTHEDRRRSIEASKFLKREDEQKRRASLTMDDGRIKEVENPFDNTSRPFIEEEIDVIRKACSVPPEHRDEEIVQHLANVLNFIMFFKQLPQQAVFDLCKDLNYMAVRGTPVELFRQGTLGTSVFLILSGKCTVYRGAKPTFDEGWKPFRDAYTDSDDIDRYYGAKQIALESPANFGELAVMKNDKQATTVVAEIDTEVVMIEKKSYDNVVMKLNSVVCMPDQCRNILDIPPEKRNSVQVSLLSDMLRRHRFFQQLPSKKPHVFRELCRHMTLLRVPENKVVCFQGQPGHQFLIILAGELALYQFDETVHEAICKEVGDAGDEQQQNDVSSTGECASPGKSASAAAAVAASEAVVGRENGVDANGRKASESNYLSSVGGAESPTKDASIFEVDDALGAAEKGVFGSEINTLNAGDSFGERALMRNEPREFTAITKAPTEIMVVEKKVFDSMVAACGKTMFAADALVAMLKVPPSRRDDATVETLCQLTKGNKFLSGLPRSIHEELCKAMTYAKCNKDSVVFYQGDVGDSFYIIITGTLSVHVKPQDNDKKESKKDRRKSSMIAEMALAAAQRNSLTDPTAIFGPSVALVRSGDSFGELSLIQGAPRAATCITREVCEFLVISKKAYDYVLADLHARELTEKISALRHIPPLQDWSESKLLKISYTFVKRTYHRGRMIVQEGDAPRNLYIILSGECRVLKRSKQKSRTDRIGGARRVLTEKTKARRNRAGTRIDAADRPMPPNFELAVMGPGDFFGEYAAMQQCKQPITILASTKTEVFTIAMSEFMKYLAEEHVVALREFSSEKMSWLVSRASHVSENLADARKLGHGDRLPGLMSAVLSRHGVTSYCELDTTTSETHYEEDKRSLVSLDVRTQSLRDGNKKISVLITSPSSSSPHAESRIATDESFDALLSPDSSKFASHGRRQDAHLRHQAHVGASPRSGGGGGGGSNHTSPRYHTNLSRGVGGSYSNLSPAGALPSSRAYFSPIASSPQSFLSMSKNVVMNTAGAGGASAGRGAGQGGGMHGLPTVVVASSRMQKGLYASEHHHVTMNEDFASSLALTSRVWEKPSPRKHDASSSKVNGGLLPNVFVTSEKKSKTRPIKGFTTNLGKPMVASDESFTHIRDARSHARSVREKL